MQYFCFDFLPPPKISIYLFHLLSQILSRCPSPTKPPYSLSKVKHVEAAARTVEGSSERREGKRKGRERPGNREEAGEAR